MAVALLGHKDSTIHVSSFSGHSGQETTGERANPDSLLERDGKSAHSQPIKCAKNYIHRHHMVTNLKPQEMQNCMRAFFVLCLIKGILEGLSGDHQSTWVLGPDCQAHLLCDIIMHFSAYEFFLTNLNFSQWIWMSKISFALIFGDKHIFLSWKSLYKSLLHCCISYTSLLDSSIFLNILHTEIFNATRASHPYGQISSHLLYPDTLRLFLATLLAS